MSTPCTTCGQPVAADGARCQVCAAPTSPAVDETASLDAVDPDGTAAPWSIPIREPRPARPAEGAPRRRGVAVLAAVALVVTVAVGSRAFDDGDAGTASRDTSPLDSAEADESGGIDVDAVRSETTTSTTPAPPTTGTPTETATPSPDAAATPVERPAATTTTTAFAARTGPNGTGSVPALSTSFRGWLAQLKSVPYDAGTDGLAEDWQRARGAVPGVVAARSDDWAAFQDGFWVLVDPGPFASADAVRAFCASAGLDGEGECLPRELRS